MNLVALSADYTPAPANKGIEREVLVRGVITMIAFPSACTLKNQFYQCKLPIAVFLSSVRMKPKPR
jgi:hypothetical protein